MIFMGRGSFDIPLVETKRLQLDAALLHWQ